ncbi:hypothetical protein F7725_002390 [Dissostichus mawsoni]|uniref:Uncharacterized protein n=1 Tax=Dissostichus mawsoni TaxID=36200 RepID=A0A7J5Y3F6_DISMA|nr:hypothetical protein F7725_002390 [Dissostichus mawsoni]
MWKRSWMESQSSNSSFIWPLKVLVVGVLSPPRQRLVAHVVWTFVHHEAATLHPAGVAAAQESIIRLTELSFMPLNPISFMLLYSPGLRYIILPLNWGCSYISQ